MDATKQDDHDHDHDHDQDNDETRSWAGDFDPFAETEERRVLFAAFDSFRYDCRALDCCNFL